MVRHHGRFDVAEESPLGVAEKRMGFDVGGAGTGADAAELVFDEEFADERFTETATASLVAGRNAAEGREGSILRYLWCPTLFGEGHLIPQYIGKGGVAILALEGRCAIQHFVDEDAESPPIYSAGVAAAFDHFRGNIFFSAHKGIRSEVCDAGFGVDCGEGGRCCAVAADYHCGCSSRIRLL